MDLQSATITCTYVGRLIHGYTLINKFSPPSQNMYLCVHLLVFIVVYNTIMHISLMSYKNTGTRVYYTPKYIEVTKYAL